MCWILSGPRKFEENESKQLSLQKFKVMGKGDGRSTSKMSHNSKLKIIVKMTTW